MYINLDNPIVERKTKTVYKDNDKTIKLFVENYSKANILNEALNQARVEEGTELAVPKLIEVSKIDNRWALVSEHIEGKPLDKLMEEHPEKEDEYLKDCISNHKTYVITGPKFSGETIWKSKITLPLLEAAEDVGASNEEIWELCKKISQATHAPVTLKEYQRMLPFAQKEKTVDTVLHLLKTYIPPFEDKYWIGVLTS